MRLTKINMKEILIHPKHKQSIAKELKCTEQTVMTSVKYWGNSPKAQKIRAKAKELLLAEAAKVTIEIKED